MLKIKQNAADESLLMDTYIEVERDSTMNQTVSNKYCKNNNSEDFIGYFIGPYFMVNQSGIYKY
jgi:hypothetical protein